MQSDNERTRELFERALRLPASERDAFVADACRDDPSSRDLLRELLRADAEAGSFLERCSLAEFSYDREELEPRDVLDH